MEEGNRFTQYGNGKKQENSLTHEPHSSTSACQRMTVYLDGGASGRRAFIGPMTFLAALETFVRAVIRISVLHLLFVLLFPLLTLEFLTAHLLA